MISRSWPGPACYYIGLRQLFTYGPYLVKKQLVRLVLLPFPWKGRAVLYNCLKSVITGGYLRGLIITNTLLKLDQSHSDSDNH